MNGTLDNPDRRRAMHSCREVDLMDVGVVVDAGGFAFDGEDART